MTSDEPNVGLRGHRVRKVKHAEDRRRAVLLAAAKVFAKRGYWTTSIDQIADELGLTKGVVYYYFSSKEDLLAEIQTRSLTEAMERLDAVVNRGGPVQEVLRSAIAEQIRNVVEGLDQYAVLLRDPHVLSEEKQQALRVMQRRYERTIQSLIERGIADGIFDPGNPKLMAFTLLRGSLGVANWYDPSGSWTASEIVENVTSQLMRGILRASDWGYTTQP